MNERIFSILSLIVKNQKIRAGDISEKLGITKRQIGYSLSQFNEELRERKLPLIKRTYAGEFIVPVEVVRSLATEYTMEDYDVYIRENERYAILILYILLAKDHISLYHIMDMINVSKNTALEDIKNIGKLIHHYQLEISYSRKYGYQILGNEEKILQLMSDLVRQYQALESDHIKYKLMASDICSLKEITYFISLIEKKLELKYSDNSLDFLNAIIPYVVIRGSVAKNNTNKHLLKEVESTKEYRLIKKNIPFSWDLPQAYLKWISLLFITSNIYDINLQDTSKEDTTLKKLVEDMIDEFEKETLIEIQDRRAFEKRLLTHLRPACFRIKHNLRLGIYNLDGIIDESNHALLMKLMKKLIKPIEKELEISFPIDELKLLSFYFGYQLNNKHIKPQKKKAVVICSNGIIVSKMMLETLCKLFPEINFLGSYSVRDFYSHEQDCDIVFTTVPLETNVPQYIIDPIIGYERQINLRYRVLKEFGITKIDYFVGEIVDIIEKNASIQNLKALKRDLQIYFTKNSEEIPMTNFKILPNLSYYLKPNYIQVTEEKLTWEKALKVSTAPLLADKIITENYIRILKQQTKTNDNYAFLGEVMAIPHASVDAGIFNDGIGFLILKKPVIFPSKKKISFIVPLAILDSSKHLRAINQLAEISVDQDIISGLLKCDNSLEAFQLIEKRIGDEYI